MSNPTNPNIKSEIVPIAAIVATVASSFYFYAHFPKVVPVHWDFAGNPNGWGSAASAAFMIPAMLVLMYFLFLFIPTLDPKKERYAEFKRAYHIFKAVIILFLAIIYFLASMNGLGYKVPIGLYVPVMIGILFMILGNYMGKFKPNWFMGIRTPWTLSDEEVWNKTHRLGGKMFIIAGLGLIAEAFLPTSLQLPIFILVICGATLVPIVYSYILFRRKNGSNGGQKSI